eukprot:XP_765157.1 hypothetical protein [Theileria parva strain Muguga]
MRKRVPDAGDFLESYFLGLSCLVCSEQFYILVSQTKASPNFQWYLLIFTSFVTLTVALIFYDESHRDLINGIHSILVVFVWVKVTSVLVTTSVTIGLGALTTFLVIEACVHYSYNAKLVLSFLGGLLSARLLPSFCWMVTQEVDGELQSRKMSLTLAVARLLFCFLSMCIKVMKGKIGFPPNEPANHEYDWIVLRTRSFKQLCNFYSQRFNSNKDNGQDDNKIFIFIGSILRQFFPILYFYLCIILFVPLSPVINSHLNKKSSFIYAPHVISSLSRLESASHLFGFCVGILIPASRSANLGFYSINIFNISFRFLIQVYFSVFLRLFSNFGIYIAIITLSTLVGYVCSYDLFVVVSNTLVQNCKDQEHSKYPCCGDKFLTECYCRYPVIINKTNKCFYLEDNAYASKPYLAIVGEDKLTEFILSIPPLTQCRSSNRFSCSKSNGDGKSLDYLKHADSAILLLQKEVGGDIRKICEQLGCNQNCCQNCDEKSCNCLKLIGIYEIDSVTTSSCDDCQLTVRIEGTKSDSCSICGGGSGGSCVCSGGNGSNCCICVKCCPGTQCTAPCTNCVKLCRCEKCNKTKVKNAARVFICYTRDQKCCIREIKPNTTPKFSEKLDEQKDFYIKSMFMSDCCHSNIQVDLHCKINFFRVTEIKYSKKKINPTCIKLCINDSKCCTQQTSAANTQTCCCVGVPLQRVLVEYPDEQKPQPSCSCPEACKKCRCCQNGKCCCCTGAELKISTENSYEKTMNPVKIKLITIFWILFLLIILLSYLIMSSVKSKQLKYYDFDPVRSYKTITKSIKRTNLNTPDRVRRRIDQFLMISGRGSHDYQGELNDMLKLLECSFDPREFKIIKNQLDEVSYKLLRDHEFILRARIEMVTWGCCLGFIYPYVVQMILRIQDYFINWEYVWEKEYKYYRGKMANRINEFTYDSKFGVAALTEVGIGLKTRMLIANSRKDTWANLSDSVEGYLDLYDSEIEFKNGEFPKPMDERLKYYVDMWDNRMEHLKEWSCSNTNIFDWSRFLHDYPGIKTWISMFGRYITLALKEIKINEKSFNDGIGVFLIDKII